MRYLGSQPAGTAGIRESIAEPYESVKSGGNLWPLPTGELTGTCGYLPTQALGLHMGHEHNEPG